MEPENWVNDEDNAREQEQQLSAVPINAQATYFEPDHRNDGRPEVFALLYELQKLEAKYADKEKECNMLQEIVVGRQNGSKKRQDQAEAEEELEKDQAKIKANVSDFNEDPRNLKKKSSFETSKIQTVHLASPPVSASSHHPPTLSASLSRPLPTHDSEPDSYREVYSESKIVEDATLPEPHFEHETAALQFDEEETSGKEEVVMNSGSRMETAEGKAEETDESEDDMAAGVARLGMRINREDPLNNIRPQTPSPQASPEKTSSISPQTYHGFRQQRNHCDPIRIQYPSQKKKAEPSTVAIPFPKPTTTKYSLYA